MNASRATMEAGYRAFKVKVGRYDLDDDVERIEVGFKTAGKGVRIMVDANHAYDATAAIRLGRMTLPPLCPRS